MIEIGVFFSFLGFWRSINFSFIFIFFVVLVIYSISILKKKQNIYTKNVIVLLSVNKLRRKYPQIE